MHEFTFRTFNLSPSGYERELSDALFSIMSNRIYAPAALATELNRSAVRPAQGGTWTAEILQSEIRRLGTWSNCVGGPVGEHSVPGAAQRTAP